MSTSLAPALRAIDDAWEAVRDTPYFAYGSGRPIHRLPDLSEQTAIAQSARAQEILDRIDVLEASELPRDLATTLAVARDAMQRQARAGRWWWTAFDPSGIGFWAIYAPTAYAGGWFLSQVARVFAAASLDEPGDVERYLGLVEDYGRVLRQLDERTRGQAERGIHLPRPQLEQAVALLERLITSVPATLIRGEAETRSRIERRVLVVVEPALLAWSAWLKDPQREKDAGEEVGLLHLPDGPEIYAAMVQQHLTLDRSVEQVHDYGLQRVAEIHAEMQTIADELGVADAAAVLSQIEADPEWHAETVEGVAAVFQRYIDRMAPHVESQFSFQPQAAYGVVALPSSMSGSMTFGYYSQPGAGSPDGLYHFNAENLTRQHLATLATLTFHELVPGHHFHMAWQGENPELHPLRAGQSFNAFAEGWAEYAAHLAGEIGLYERPEERFGRLMMDAFLTTRLVVDTGMNAFGWSLERARDFMRANAFISETEVLTESLRYSCDIPAQALAYKMGQPFLVELREEMRTALGDRFDIRDFHEAVVRPGGLPLSEVAANVEHATEARLRG